MEQGLQNVPATHPFLRLLLSCDRLLPRRRVISKGAIRPLQLTTPGEIPTSIGKTQIGTGVAGLHRQSDAPVTSLEKPDVIKAHGHVGNVASRRFHNANSPGPYDGNVGYVQALKLYEATDVMEVFAATRKTPLRDWHVFSMHLRAA